MKKIYVAMMVLGTMLLSSCVQEKNFNNVKVGENELAFVMQGVSTRSGEDVDITRTVKGVSIPMGNGIILEETVEELNPSPATKGSPAYTVNVTDLYPTLGVYAAKGSFGDAVFGMMDTEMYDDKGWRFIHKYSTSPWPESDTDPVDFYLRMPSSDGDGVTMNADHVSFELTSPLDGKDQKDLLFGQATYSKAEHDTYLPGGMPVTMKHALTGIKFRNGHKNDQQTKTVITRVELVGLNKHGVGTIGEDGVVTWDPSAEAVLSTDEEPFYLVFDNPDYTPAAGASNPDGTVTEWDEKLKTTNWAGEKAAADHNLNHANGELTFWFIPQEVPDNLVLKLEFLVKIPDVPGGTSLKASVNLGELLNGRSQEANGENLTWEAGQLRTYTLKPYDVDVEIEDDIKETVKSNLHVANTGNVDEYVRMLIMGNWYGWKPGEDQTKVKPSILVGYKYEDEADAAEHGGHVNDMVEPWFRGGDNGVDPYGTFDSSFLLASLGNIDDPNARNGKKDDWADASGGFYYTMPIGPGAGMGTTVSATKDLFKSYTVQNVPDIWLSVGGTRVKAEGVHLVMEIVVQAIAVPTYVDENGDTKNVWWLQAWYDATGIKKLDPEATGKNAKFKALWQAGEYDSGNVGR